VRATLAVVLVGALVWFIPRGRPGEEGGHHPGHGLDAFEKAGISEFKEGQRGPAFSLVTLDGRRTALADYRDKLVILNFWATWCGPCTDEMPTLEALWRDHRARGLVVLGVSVDRGGPRALLEPYVRNLALTFPILLDPDSQTARAWRVTALPATFVVKPGGEVAGNAVGTREWRSEPMQALLTGMLPTAHPRR
jgi:peroxiredoxin